jgi:hypothetical protein
MSHIHIIHENDEWTAPLLAELDALGHPYRDWHLGEGRLALDEAPPAGVFYSRMSASSHTRGHRYAPELTGGVLAWLESHGARVLNGTRALALEVSKMAQYAALRQHGIPVPRTEAALGREQIVAAACNFPAAFITKHNRAGKGLGVRLHQDVEGLIEYLDGPEFEPSVDGITLLQSYVRAPTPHITRVEFIGQELLYAVRVDTSEGFELCPADACGVGASACPVSAPASIEQTEKFAIIDDFRHPLVDAYRSFMVRHELQVAAFEFIVDGQGEAYTYDINTNTNYNPGAEARAGHSGMRALARFLGVELARRNMLDHGSVGYGNLDRSRARLSVASR